MGGFKQVDSNRQIQMGRFRLDRLKRADLNGQIQIGRLKQAAVAGRESNCKGAEGMADK